ncbi:hypothetical protein C7N43_36655 [Sphingobacteriales bacterium UPWRP_1]|nr:hypothetical protein BVG80_05820 [Sphingobacteriales bacterium TSM_CSM]PSJ71960.1 hypothetical protein C7N43_36655 [Sphingobacteriales bacterium UPWRP_1]
MLLSNLQNNLLTQAKTQTEARNDTEGDKTLIATYQSEQKPDSAWLYLQQIPEYWFCPKTACPQRQTEFAHLINWLPENVLLNQKHGYQYIGKD